MNRISMFKVLAVLFGLAVTATAAEAAPKSVMSGAMDICKAVDGGEVTMQGDVEICCAQPVTEYDDGHMDFGNNYCVACVQGTDNCVMDEGRLATPRNVKKALTIKPAKQAPVTGN